MRKHTNYIAVAGGANIDIGGKSRQRLLPRDSNPGTVKLSLGGVARNIAHNLALLDVPVKLFTAIGNDLYADLIIQSCNTLGIDLHARRSGDASTSTYLYIADTDGDMVYAVSDMDVCAHLTPAFFKSRMDLINGASALVIDTNMPEETVLYLAKNARVPVFADPVSTAKAGRLQAALPHLHTIKPNRAEAELLCGIPVNTNEDALRAARMLLEKGIQQVFLTLGADGVLVARNGQADAEHIPPCHMEAHSFTGAGDAFMAGLVCSYLRGYDPVKAAHTASAAAAVAAASMETINEALSPAYLDRVVKDNEA